MPTKPISQTSTYRRWIAMKSRCENPNHSRYKDWGGKGVTICERWASFENFLADMGEVPSRLHTLDRYPDPNGNYEPANCRWATRSEQQRNRRDSIRLTFKDRTMSIYDWADETGISMFVIRSRIGLGWPVERIFGEPVNHNFGRTGRLITFNGETKSISEWARATGIKIPTIWWRLDNGWPLEQVFKQP